MLLLFAGWVRGHSACVFIVIWSKGKSSVDKIAGFAASFQYIYSGKDQWGC